MCRLRVQIAVIYTVIGTWCSLQPQSEENGTCKTPLLIFHISQNLSSFLSIPGRKRRAIPPALREPHVTEDFLGCVFPCPAHHDWHSVLTLLQPNISIAHFLWGCGWVENLTKVHLSAAHPLVWPHQTFPTFQLSRVIFFFFKRIQHKSLIT